MNSRKAEELSNDKAYQLLADFLPEVFPPLEKRHRLFINPETPYDKRINKQNRSLNKEIDGRNAAKIKAASKSGMYQLAKNTIEMFKEQLKKELQIISALDVFIKEYAINPKVIEGLRQRGVDVDSEKTRRWLISDEPGSQSWRFGPFRRVHLIEGATELHPSYSLDSAAKAIQDLKDERTLYIRM